MSVQAEQDVVRVEGLSLGLRTGDRVVEDVSFTVRPGEIVGLVGESGSGKTTTALALLGYTRPGVVIAAAPSRWAASRSWGGIRARSAACAAAWCRTSRRTRVAP